MSIYLKNTLRFICLILIQVLILNKISLRWWASINDSIPPFSPFLYPLFILLLPINTPVWFQLVISFFLGLSIDAFMDTGGMHASACVFIAFLRPKVLSALLPNKLEDYSFSSPCVKSMGWTPYLTYASILLFVHHLVYYILEIWSFSSISYLLIKLFLTLITSILLILIYTLLFSNNKQGRLE